MTKPPVLLIIVCLLLCSGMARAQGNIVRVNPLTGIANVSIPIYVVRQGEVSMPVSLVYNATGVKPSDVEGSAGVGWNIAAGGQVYRQVRGLPDDITKDNKGNGMYGWMSPLDTAAGLVPGFVIDNNGSTCSHETTDIAYINAHFPYRDDTEPDIFDVNAPGLSCRLVYNRDSSKFIPLSYQDLVISYTLVGGSGNDKSNIASFTITNDQGIRYEFAAPETITQTTSPGSGLAYFKNEYLQYHNGITYYDSWNLVSITDPNGNGVLVSYDPVPQTNGADSTALYLAGASSYSLQYRTLNTVTSQRMAAIATVNVNKPINIVAFSWTTLTGQSGQTVIDSISAAGNTFHFDYSQVDYTPKNYLRDFLRTMYVSGCGSPVNYKFQYAGEYHLMGGYNTALPDSTSVQRDYWGYYSTTPSTSSLMPRVWMTGPTIVFHPYAIYEPNTGAVDTYPYSTSNVNANDRSADPNNVVDGALNKIILPDGGSANITYESNDYLDWPSGNVVQGGGIRVKTIIDSASAGTAPMEWDYSYLNPSTGLSSGKPLSLPDFAFMLPYSGSLTGSYLYNSITALSAYDMSPEDHTIMYEYTKVSRPGAGYTLYQYHVPATNWDMTATPDCSGCNTAEWAPVIDYVGRNDCSVTYGPIGNHTNTTTYSYPFAPNPNYDFERGLPLKISSYNNDATPKEVSETTYAYQRSYPLKYLYGFKWEDDPNGSLLVKCYSKYRVFYGTSELTDTVTTKVFDAQGTGTSQTNTAIYTYGSPYHKLLTQKTVTNSDNSVLTTNLKYVKDYASAASSNGNINALHQLELMNVNMPVETWTNVTRGGTTLTTSAALTLFNSYTVNGFTHYLPSKQYKLMKADGEHFTPFSINTGTSAISLDTGYSQTVNFDTYDDTGFPLTTDDTHHHVQTAIADHFSNHVAAVFANAAYHEIAFSDFDSNPYAYTNYTPDYNFTISGPVDSTIVIYGSHAGNAASLGSGQTLSHASVTKNAIAKNYILSLWIDAPAGSNALYVSLNGGASITCSYTGAGWGHWKYYSWTLPVGSMPSSFSISVTTSHTIGIDDVLFYPDVAAVTTMTYDPVGHYKIAETNTNGVSSYRVNDQWGRVLYVLDQDKNILQKNTYVNSDEANSLVPMISQFPTPVAGSPASFSIYNVPSCYAAGITVTWDFGDGSSPVNTALTTSPTHTYTVMGTYTVTATVHSALFGDKTVTYAETVLPKDITLSFNKTLPTGHGNLVSITFSQGGVTKYSFSSATMPGGTIKQGVYNIQVVITNPYLDTAYSCSLSADNWWGCNNYTASSTLTFNYTADLTTSTSLMLALTTVHCGSSGP